MYVESAAFVEYERMQARLQYEMLSCTTKDAQNEHRNRTINVCQCWQGGGQGKKKRRGKGKGRGGSGQQKQEQQKRQFQDMDGDVEMRHRGERGGKRYQRQKGLAMGVRDVEMHDAEASLQKHKAGSAIAID